MGCGTADFFSETMTVFIEEQSFTDTPRAERLQPQFKFLVQVMTPGSWNPPDPSQNYSQTHIHTLYMCNQASTRKKMLVMNTKVAKCGAQTQIDRRRISYRDSGNYSTSSIGRQLSHLLLLLLPPVPSIICSPDNKKQQRENPKQTAENRHLTVCICDRRGTCVSVCV